ncbi:MAG: glutathione S-transferase family protein [Deltaproteobacteria bacterium]|nr:glutathione S-transferase family protein [Deltaproteobacteria bacterium]
MTAHSTLVGFQEDITLPHRDEWELYHNSFSLCSKKLRVCLSELAIDYRSHHIDLIETGSYENVGRDYLAINPAGLLPVLLHRGHPIYESHEEIVYAAAHAATQAASQAHGKELMPDDPIARADVERWIDCASLVGPNPTRGTKQRAGHCIPGLTLPIFATMVHHIPTRNILRGLLSHPNKERPLIFLSLKTLGIHRLPKLGPAMRLLRQSLRHMGQHLDSLGEQLDKHAGPWIAGERFSLADVSWMVILDRLVEADWDTILWGGASRPSVSAYWQRLEARESYRTQVLEMRCPITRKGMAEVRQAKAADSKLKRALEE